MWACADPGPSKIAAADAIAADVATAADIADDGDTPTVDKNDTAPLDAGLGGLDTQQDGGADADLTGDADAATAPQDVNAPETAASDATVSDSTVSDSTVSDAIASDAIASDAIASDATASDAIASDAIASDATGSGTSSLDGVASDSVSGDIAQTDAEADVGAAPDVDSSPWVGLSKPTTPTTLPPAAFADASTVLGINLNKTHGFCVAIADFNNDSTEDFAVVELNFGNANIHTVLLGGANPKDLHSPIDTTLHQPAFGCSAVDISGDGKPDMLLGGYTGVSVYIGDGKGKFVDKTSTYMPNITNYAAYSVQPVDLDGDGDLDLFIGAGFQPPPCEGLKCFYTKSDLVCSFNPPAPINATMQDRVLIRGKTLPFVDETAKWNVPEGGNQTVVMAVDVDGDGKQDVLTGDELDSHRLLRNVGGKFASHHTDIGFHASSASMGWSAGDLNGDGLLDMVLADAGPTPVYIQKKAAAGKPAAFYDAGGILGVWWPSWGASAWAPQVADFDLDGQDDVLLAISVNFSAKKMLEFVGSCTAFMNPSNNPFKNETSIDVLFTHHPNNKVINGMPQPMVAQRMPAGSHAHGLMLEQRVIDIDGDGDLDVVQARPGPNLMPSARIRVLRNISKTNGKHMRIIVTGKGLNMDALGTVVHAEINGVVRKRWLSGSGGFGGNPTRFAHYGLGKSTKATNVKVVWPDGKVTKIGDVLAGATKKVTWL